MIDISPKNGSHPVAAAGIVKTEPDSWVDPSITYPSYKSFDDLIDVQRLRSLDGYITQRLRRRLKTDQDMKFYTGPYTLAGTQPGRPGSRMVYLARSSAPDSYFDLDKTELWQPTPDADEFAMLMEFIRTLPFRSTGRILIMYDDVPRSVTPHRDHVETEICHEFLWFRTNLRKPFFMLNPATGEKKYVSTYSAWFDSVNQFHGSDACDGLSFSIRVDGHFTDEFRQMIPRPERNAASTPSYWAARSEHSATNCNHK
ncbi:MAG: hypothetical protein JO053_01720 [Acidobacteria bacterium]|nr:hypothetical protein [Acidobacteriota bacterium]